MRRHGHRETVTAGGIPPSDVPLVLVVTEGPPDLVALEPRPEFHSPTEIVLAAVDIDTRASGPRRRSATVDSWPT